MKMEPAGHVTHKVALVSPQVAQDAWHATAAFVVCRKGRRFKRMGNLGSALWSRAVVSCALLIALCAAKAA